jgi:aminoglycoside N3'-acetyltransferase
MRHCRRLFQRSVRLEELVAGLRSAGIQSGDIVMVHSSLSRLGKVEGGAGTVIQALLDTITSKGSLMMPAYGDARAVMDAATPGRPVDLRTAPSLDGLIAETFRCRPDVLRSSHPFSSVCVWGQHRVLLTEGHANDTRICHRDSPLGRLLKLRGKILGLGVSLGPVSFYHVVEDTWDDFPIDPYLPAMPVTYIDAAGVPVTRSVQRYDPAISRTRVDQRDGVWIRQYITTHFTAKGILHRFPLGHGQAWVIKAEDFYREIQELAQRGITIYTTEAEFWQRCRLTAEANCR